MVEGEDGGGGRRWRRTFAPFYVFFCANSVELVKDGTNQWGVNG